MRSQRPRGAGWDCSCRSADDGIPGARRLAYAGIVSIAVALTSQGELAGDPDVHDRPACRLGCATVPPPTSSSTRRFSRRSTRCRGSAATRFRWRFHRHRACGTLHSLQAAWGKRPQVHVLIVAFR